MEILRAARDLRVVSVRRSQITNVTPVIVSAVLASVAALVMANASAANGVGAIAGQGGVSDAGAATYNIPIVLPPGTHGMQPSLGLAYSSQGGDSLEGYGWVLSGFSAISRCSENYDDNGHFQAIQIAPAGNASDNFCLDGQRLRYVSGPYGGDGSIYRTEINDFSVIVSHGTAGNGPSWFTVQTKDGRTYEYGNTADSKVVFQGTSSVRTWALDRVTDASGNYMTYAYGSSSTAGVEYWPTSISYTGNGSTTPDHTIQLVYTARSTATIKFSYVHGSLITLSNLLTKIKVLYGTANTVTATYNLTYNQDPGNGRNRLASVQQCGLNSDCLPATSISWTDTQAGWSGDVSTGVSVGDAAHAQAAHLMDVDGDGIEDLVYPDTTTNHWLVMFGKPGGGFTAPVDTGDPLWGTATFYQYALVMDYNGDGKMDFMVPIPSGWQVFVATGNRTPGQGGIFRTPGNSIPYMGATNSVTGNPIYEGNVWMADFSGGELADMFDTDGTSVSWQQNGGPSTGETFTAPETAFSSANLKKFTNPEFADVGIDFDGSGRAGGLLLSSSGYTGSWVALNTTSNNTLTEMASVDSINTGFPAVPVDANGDGLTDLLTFTYYDAYAQISLSTGTGFNTIATTVTPWLPVDYGDIDDGVAADYYADGRKLPIICTNGGVACIWEALVPQYSGTQFSVSIADLFSSPLTANGYESGTIRVGNIEANGFDDIVYAVPTTSGSNTVYTWHYRLHAGANGTPGDLVTKVTDGFGNFSQFQYASLASGTSVYTQNGNPSYPVRMAQFPVQVVSTYTMSDGTGGSYNLTYTYANAEMETQGRGFLGFGSRTITDSRNGNVETITYRQDFPFIGAVEKDVLNAGNGSQIQELDNTAADLSSGTPQSNDSYYPFVTIGIATDYDLLSGTVQPVNTVETDINPVDFDVFGNLTHELIVTTDLTQGSAKYQTERWFGYPTTAPSNNCFSLPDSVKETRTVPAGSLGIPFTNPATRTVTNSVDRANCRLHSQSVSGSGVSLTTTYDDTAAGTSGYDQFGNLIQTEVSGTNLATRLTTYSYAGGNGEFPTSKTRVVSATDSITSSMTWDYRFGIKASDTDPNGNPTTYTPDDFGRPTSVTRPDGSQTSFSYNWCPGDTFCSAGAQYEITSSEVSGSTSITTGYTAYDGLGRPVEQGTMLLGGVISKVDTAYNALGDAAEVSKPYAGSRAQYDVGYTYDVTRNRLTEVDGPQDANDLCTPGYNGGPANTCQNVMALAYSGFTVTTTHRVGDSAASSNTQVTSQTKDALGQILSTEDAANSTTSYNYDAFGDLVGTQDADGKLSTMTYDGLGHKTGMVDPNMGNWSYQVDALGEILCQTDAKGQSIIMGYDNAGRMTSKLETAAGAGCQATSGTSSTWTYDTQTKGVGLPASVTDSNGFERDYAYDSFSRASDITTTPGAGASQYTLSTTYDNFGRVQTVTYPVSVTPAAAGTAPTAVAIATPTSVTAGTAVTLDGSGSTDPNNLGLQYQWTQTAGPTANAGSFDPASAKTSFVTMTGGVYGFQLQVIDSSSAQSAPASVSVTVKPALPPLPTVTSAAADTGEVDLSWNSDPNVSSYDVYQSADDVTFTFVKNVACAGSGYIGNYVPPTTAAVTGVPNGTYYFAVVAKANGVASDRGPAASAQMIFHAPTPSGLADSGDPSHVGSYTVSWNAVSAPGTTITYYLEEAASDSLVNMNLTFTQKWSGTFAPGVQPRVALSHPGNGAYYYFYVVRASNVNGYSGYSNEDSIHIVVRPGVPGAFSPASQSNHTGNFTISWAAASGRLSYYQMFQDTTTSFSSETWDGNTTTASESASESLGTWYFRVRACNSSDGTTVCSDWDSYATGTYTAASGGGGGGKGGGGGCPPPPYQCQLVLNDGIASTQIVAPALGSGALLPIEETAASPVALRPVLAPTPPNVESDTLAALTSERQELLGHEHLQPAESALQARFDRLHDAMPQTLAMGRDEPQVGFGFHTGTPAYAPPVYQAYAVSAVKAVANTPYRFTVQYNYDPVSGALLSVSNADTGFIYWRAATDTGNAPVDAFNHITGYVDGNNVSTVSVYDAATGAIQGIGTGTGTSSSVQSLIYTWDGFGNLKQRCDTNKGLMENFTYDALNRLATSNVYTGATYASSQCSSSATPESTLGMSYDAVGNIQTRANSGLGLSDTYAYNDPNHPYAVTGVTSIPGTYSYDANGNMQSGNGRTITWNDDNLPVTIASSGTQDGNLAVTGSSTFAYSPDSQRYSQLTTDSVAGNSTTLYVGSLFEVVSNSSTTQYRHNIVADGQTVAVHTIDQAGNATTDYIHSDNLGSLDTITDDTGSIAQQSSFDAFGLRRDPTNWTYDLTGTQISSLKSETDRGYTFQEQLDDVSLVHMNGRLYDPSIGRMISADPKMPDPLYSQAFNRYAYVYDNPARFTDPSGFTPGLWGEGQWGSSQYNQGACDFVCDAQNTYANGQFLQIEVTYGGTVLGAGAAIEFYAAGGAALIADSPVAASANMSASAITAGTTVENDIQTFDPADATNSDVNDDAQIAVDLFDVSQNPEDPSAWASLFTDLSNKFYQHSTKPANKNNGKKNNNPPKKPGSPGSHGGGGGGEGGGRGGGGGGGPETLMCNVSYDGGYGDGTPYFMQRTVGSCFWVP